MTRTPNPTPSRTLDGIPSGMSDRFSSTPSHNRSRSARPGGIVGALLSVALLAFLVPGCENKEIGRPCALQTAPGDTEASVNSQALECPTRLCLKAAVAGGSVPNVAPLCTAECSDDSDCDTDNIADKNNSSDLRCKAGFTCAMPLETGDLCCKKLCVCRDYLPTGYTFSVPEACNPSVSSTINSCKNIKR